MIDSKIYTKQLISRRTLIIGAGKLGFLFLLAGKMFYMQFIRKSDYTTLSDKNRIKIIVLNPSRGQIYDRNMNLVAKNNTCFRLLLDKNITPNFNNEVKAVLEILELDDDQIKEITKKIKNSHRSLPLVIIDCLDWKQISIIEEKKDSLNSLFIDTGDIRYYKYGNALVHLLGYMGKINKTEKKDFDIIDESFRVGKNGIEKFYESSLRGEFGYKHVEINAHGSYVRELSKKNTIKGANLELNIDADLQNHIMLSLNHQGSSAVIMDCRDGGILGLNSTPAYDPNKFNFLSNKYWSSLMQDPYKPLINKVIHSLYPPGSIFKLITILAALKYGIEPTHKAHCDGSPMLGGNSFRCSSRRGHGSIDMHDAIKYSCNTYIFSIAKIIGPQDIINMAKNFGFGDITGIDLPGELSGFVPTLEWKTQNLKEKWSIGDTFNLSIGQGFLLSTPIQLSRFITAIATNGKLYTPRVVKSQAHYNKININQQNLDFLKGALYSTVNTPGGTGYSGKISGNLIQMAGKTGTAQVQAKRNADDDLSRANIAWHRRNHAIFTGYAPYDDPKYSITIYYDHGGGGGRAASPIAKSIMEKIFL